MQPIHLDWLTTDTTDLIGTSKKRERKLESEREYGNEDRNES